ncbi:phage tail tape measure protein [Bernardetia sp. Wsw4-3y2]|uniref:phage tail tape measure protein n=1 Tax=Bernardetia sp. Wsw4-3y2 TaxID=3127471 RepID=UPI0030D5F023
MAQEKVQVTAIIDGKQAINELGKLEIAQSELKNEIKSLGGPVRQYENALKKLEKYKVGKEKFESAQKEVQRLNSFISRYDNLLQSANNTLAKTSEGTAEYGKAKTKVDALTNSISNYKAQLQAANKEVKKNENAAKQFDKQDKEVKKLESSVKNYDDALKRASDNQKKIEETTASLRAQDMTMRQLQKEAKKLKVQLDNTVSSSPKWAEMKKRFNELNTQIRSQNDELNSTQTGWKKFTSSFKGFGVMAAGVIGGEIVMQAFQWITSFVIGIATGAAKISDELSDIQKSTGMTAKEVKSLNSELGKIDTRSSNASLREIAKVAGQLGIKKEEIKGFTEQVDKMNVALGDEFSGGAEEITRKVGTLQTLFKETKNLKADEAMNRIGSSLNALGAAGKARAPEVSDFANRLGVLGKLAPSIQETLGLGAALTGEFGLTAEQAAGGVRGIILEAGKNIGAFATQIGITQEEFKNLLNNDPNEMFLRLGQSMQGLNNDQIITALTNMKVGTDDAIAVMQQLAENTDLVVEKQALAAKEFDLATSLQAEFNLKNENFAATLEKAGKAWNSFVAGIGSTFQPIMQVALQLFTKLFSKTEKAPESLQPLIKVFSKLWDSLKTIFGAVWDVINAFGIFDGESDLWRSSIKILAAVVEVLAFQFNYVAKKIKEAKKDFIEFYNESETFRRIVTGSVAAVKQVFQNFFKTVGDGFEAIKDLLVAIATGDLKLFESALSKTWEVLKDLAYGNAVKVGEKFAEGYIKGADKIEIKPKVDTVEAEKKLEDFTKKQESLIAKVQGLKKLSSSDKNPVIQELEFYSQSTEEQRKAIEEKVNQLIATNNQRLFASNNKAAGKKANKETDDLIKQWQEFNNKIQQYKKENFESTLSEQEKEISAVADKYNAMLAELEKFQKAKEISEAEKQARENELTELFKQERLAIEQKYKEQELAAKEEARKQIDESLLDEFDSELLAVENKYNELIRLAEEHGLEITALEQAKADAIDAIYNKQTESQTAKTIEENEKQRQANFEFAGSLMDIFTATNNLMGEQSAGYLEFQKMITIAQLAIDTASAISSITSKSAATSITPIDMAIKIASGIAVVIGNIAKAKQVLSTAEMPKAPKFDKYSKGGGINITGDSHANGGVSMINKAGQKVGEMEGGESYLLLSKDTTRNNSPLINALLQSSQTNGAAVQPNFAGMQQAIRTSNTTINNTTNQNSNSDELLMRLIAETRMNREAFENMKRESKSYVVYSEFKDVDDRMNSIKNYQGQ